MDLVDAELGAEVGDRPGELVVGIGARRPRCVPAVRAVLEIPAELVEQPAGVDHEVLVGGELRPAARLGRRAAPESGSGAGPGGGVDPAEERPRPGRPAPPQVVCKLSEPFEAGGEIQVELGKDRDLYALGHKLLMFMGARIIPMVLSPCWSRMRVQRALRRGAPYRCAPSWGELRKPPAIYRRQGTRRGTLFAP